MRRIDIVFGELLPALPGGVVGEHGATEIVVDVRKVLAVWSDGLFSIHAQPTGSEAYEVMPPTMANQDGLVRYALTSAETALPGVLRVMVSAESGDKIAKAHTIDLTINEGLD